MKALVTGATGFAGRYLVEHLAAAGDSVVAFEDEGARVDVTDSAAVDAALGAAAPDVVYHLAASTHIGESWGAPAAVFRVNAEGTLNVLRACLRVGVGRVLVIGSADEYGAVGVEHLPITEDTPLRPRTPYGASKVAAEFLALQAFLGDELGTIRVRAFNHTGPGQAESYLVPGLARRIADVAHGRDSTISVGSLDAVRDFTDVRDVVRAYRLLVEKGAPGDVYNVCSGQGSSVQEVADRLVNLSHVEVTLRIDAELVRPIEVPALVGDRRKLTATTGWQPEIALDDTLAEVLASARARGD
jgi:GDP-4-dehydro-6-deoxy-D-mannose reductase